MSGKIGTAFVLGAGLGTRLRPLTETRPKPLVPVFHKPLITYALDHLIAAGVEKFVINTHHQAEAFEEEFGCGTYRGCPVVLSFEPELLDTGGGMKKAQALIGSDPFLVYSGDILTDIDVGELVDEHFCRGNDVTLALRDTGFSTSLAFQGGRVTDIRNRYGQGEGHDFANVSVWNASIFDRLPAEKKISFVPVVSDWIGRGGRIGGVLLNENTWFNIGSRKEYLDVHRTIFEGGWTPAYREENWPAAVHPTARISPSARLEGWTVVGAGAQISDGAVVRNSVIWENAEITSRSSLEACIVRDGQRVEGTLQAEDV